ncbi:MAG: four-carbon acid sugar kinase family protein, partial [Microbacteriaceae bacterium]|nr:four-carbon acid sugar kinase family protein [Microbacteriaceae bacterium]
MTDEASELAQFPYEVIIDPATVEALVAEGGTVLVVLDDDPTGTQSVSGLPVLTTWDESDLEWALTQNCPAVYVLTNTRSLAPETAALRNREIVTNAIAASANTGVHIAFVSRSDSTLRGHYPLETDVIAQTIAEHGGRAVDGVIIVPAFPEAGRVTIGGIHYMRGEHGLTPVAETEYANDASFGYANSRLSDWVSEKSHGRYAASDVIVLDLGVIRSGTAAIVTALAAAS